MKTLRVLLIDDHQVVRLGLRFTLDDLPDVRVIGEAANADEAVEHCRHLQPDVVIMEIKMPGRSGVDACREIVNQWPQIRVIMLSSFVDDDLIAEVINAGAAGYVLKDVGTGELVLMRRCGPRRLAGRARRSPLWPRDAPSSPPWPPGGSG